MKKLVKKYALVSTSYYDDGEWKKFHIIIDNLTEEDIIKISNYADEYNRLWKENYENENENAKKRITKDLRTDLEKFLNEPILDDFYSIEDYHKLWLEKDLIIEHFVIEEIKEESYENMLKLTKFSHFFLLS